MNLNKLNTIHLFIVRHGHAQFNANSDFERELKSKGIKAVENTARFIKSHCDTNNLKDRSCLSSSALRTQQTAQIICNDNNISQCIYDRTLYSTSASIWLDKISKINSNTIVIVGHNPTFSSLLTFLCGNEIYMKPANCAYLKLEFKSDGIIYPSTLIDFHHNE